MTVLDFVPKHGTHPTVTRIGIAPVLRLPLASTRRQLEAGFDSAVDALTFLLMQADACARTPRIPEPERNKFAGQVQAYAFALGVLVHPDSPADAVAVKQAIQSALAAGPLDAADLRLIALPEMVPTDAC
jgi:hypothetical protein